MAGPVVVVAGAMANKPANGGEAWVRLSWIRGLERLGCRVWFVEEIAEDQCTDDQGRSTTFAKSANRRWYRAVMARFGLAGRSSLLCDNGQADGAQLGDLRDAIAEGALLVNISGNLSDPALRREFGRQAYVDIDPGFTQYWYAAGNRGARLADHDRYFTIGENIGTADCHVPADDHLWSHVRQPVVLDDWRAPVAHEDFAGDPLFTTIATWRGPYGPIEHNRRRFGLKLHEFRKFIDMPGSVAARFEAALAIHPDEVPDLTLLHDRGWRLVDPLTVAGTPDSFREYVAGSTAEFSAAQGMYVETRSGWFSDRSTRYLASGRPALVQDTGFRDYLPSDKGLIAFRTLAEATAGAEAILADPAGHARAARSVAEEHFDSDLVLSRFLDDCDLG